LVAFALGLSAPRLGWAQPCSPEALIAPDLVIPYSATPAGDWTDLFDREAGWTGADGVYSVPLSGDERPCSASDGATFWTFSDTFVGEVDENGGREAGWSLINNTMAFLTGSAPDADQIDFYWRGRDDPRAVVAPEGGAGDWFWPQDGIVLDGHLYLYSLRMAGLQIAGVTLLRTTIGDGRPFAQYDQVEAPLYAEIGGATTTYSRALLENTVRAGAPAPDGYVYLYGLNEQFFNKGLLVARFRPEEIESFTDYRFWNGTEWSPDPTEAVAVVEQLSAEFSVSPLDDGRFLLVYEASDFLGGEITVRLGDSPFGPWSDAVPIYRIPETDVDPDLFAYGPKAHPHLSHPDRLLISYHVNTFDFLDHLTYADIYRPRFVEWSLVAD